MRIFKDLDMVEQLGSGVPRILKAYDKSCFIISDNYLRMVFPSIEPVFITDSGNQVSNQDKFTVSSSLLLKHLEEVSKLITSSKIKEKHNKIAKELTTEQCQILKFLEGSKKRKEILEDCLKISNQTKNFKKYIEPLLELNLIQRTLPDRPPNSQHQKYVLTNAGKSVLYLWKKQKAKS